MPAQRTLPIAAEHREFTVKVGGQDVPRENALQSLSVVAAANRIASARLVYVDGAAGAGDFPLSNQSLFEPGAQVEIQAGAGSSPATLFKGLVTGQRLRVREGAAAQLVVDCRHACSALANVRRSANFFAQTDSDVIGALFSGAGVNATVDTTSVTHAQLVQFDCSDWDFIVTRAAANGLLVLTRAADVSVVAPATGSAAAEMRYGATLLEFDAEIDARLQTQAVQAYAWSGTDQSVHAQAGSAPSITPPGNFVPDTLAGAAGSAEVPLRHAALDDAEATALASAEWQRRRLDMVSGRAKCVGIGTLLPGDTVTLAGVGDRFSGDVLVTGVRHEFDTTQGWKTHLQFGGVEPDDALAQRLQQRRAASVVAPAPGLQIGVVTDLEDPDGEFRIRVRLPLVNDADDGVWARVASPDAGSDRGMVYRPEAGDEVVVGFLDEDPRHAVVLGMLHSSAMAAPIAAANANPQKGYKSRSGIQLLFDDDQKIVSLATPGGNRWVLDDDAQGITIEDQNGNRIALTPDGITIESAKALTLKSGTEGSLEGGTSLDLKAGTALTVDGSASTDVKSGGTVKVAGAQVQIG